MIIMNEIKAFFRDKMNLSLMIAFPIILIYLLGNLLSQQDYADEAIGELHIGYMVESVNPVEVVVIDEFIKGASEEGNVVFEQVAKEEKARDQVAHNELEGLVIFGKDEILLYEGKDMIKNRTISALITGYSNTAKAIKAIAYSAPNMLTNIKAEENNFVEEKEFSANRSMLDYYGVAMIVMMVFVGSIMGAGTFGEEIRLKTVNRLIGSPISRTKIFIQKVIGQIPSAVVEIVVVMVVSTLFFDVHYAANVGDNLILFLLFLLSSFTMLTVGIVIGLFIKANPFLVLMPVLWVMMFLSGTFAKPITIKGISQNMPAYRLQQAAFDITVFGNIGKATSFMLVDIVIIIIMTVIGVVKFNRMQEAKERTSRRGRQVEIKTSTS